MATLSSTQTPWQSETPVALLPHVLRLTAPNPGVMTGPGTNSYLVGTPDTGFSVIDPGPADPAHLQRLWQAAATPDGQGGNIVRIVCTHSHPDHSPWRCSAASAVPAPTAHSGPAFGTDSTTWQRVHSRPIAIKYRAACAHPTRARGRFHT